jgi:pimeloyl-ACP methyl ester carboxylesterase
MNIPRERYTKINSIKTRFMSEGEGSPVILIHGWGGSASGWLPSFSALSSRHAVYALDLFNHGLTGKIESGSVKTGDMAKFVADFMTELKIKRAHIIGHSMGGGISLLLAINFPERVEKLVLIDSIGLGKEIERSACLASLPLVGEIWASQAYGEDIAKYGRNLRASAQNPGIITDELIENLYRVERTPEHAKTVLKIFRLWFNWTGQKKSIYESIIQKLPDISNPILIIWGKQDATVPLSHAEFAAKTMPNARLEVIDKCGHVPMFDQPETFNRLVLDFLQE